jgi:hypothetical protein
MSPARLPEYSLLFGRSLKSLYRQYRSLFPPLQIAMASLERSEALPHMSVLFSPVISSQTDRELQSICKYFERVVDTPEKSTVEAFSIEALGAFVKLFLERLPEPVLTFQRYQQFIKSVDEIDSVFGACSPQRDLQDRLFFVQSLLVTLPRGHYLVTERILRFLYVVCTQQHITNINASRMAVLFADDFLRERTEVKYEHKHDQLLPTSAKQHVLLFLIEHYEQLFCYNPIREWSKLLIRQSNDQAIIQHVGAQVTKMTKEQAAIRFKAAYTAFRKRVLVKHFLV